MLTKSKILGVDITNETDKTILEYLWGKLRQNGKFYIVTPNPEILVYANRHENYKKILNNAEISLPDGTGLFLASIFMGKPFRERIPGVDFVELICKNSVRNPISIGFLGGKSKIAEKAAERLMTKYPHLRIVYVAEEWDGLANGKPASPAGRWQMANGSDNKPYAISDKPIDLLFVAFGHPKQEEWIYNNLDKIPVKAAMGVGGAFDYISGHVKRAPFMIRAIGFEWFYRLVKEPWRFRRQLALIEFVKLVIRERFS
jgi:N-acetylglucosaminyldiphosphoundecaprenol N-acetyl-beta-D-mannosaminyltransferase